MLHNHIGKTCPYCQFPIKQDSEAVQCPACKVPHHRECWEQNGGCTTFGCREKTYLETAEERLEISFGESSGQQAATANSGGINKLLAGALVLTLLGLIVVLFGYINLLSDRRGEIANSYGEEEQEYDVVKDGDYLLALVTKETKLKSDYVPSDLDPIPAYMNLSYDMQLRAMALEMLKAMWYAAKEDDVILSIRSAYRSYSTQEGLFENYASRYGIEEANRFSRRPGQSEHQLGTTVDFGGTAVDYSPEFAQTEQGEWLAENAHRFGFVMSYPEGKEDVTGYIFESWHYRYIGADEIRAWKGSGKTLREYLETRPQEFVK